MNKLKTLKDINIRDLTTIHNDYRMSSSEVVSVELLRYVAREWVKRYKKDFDIMKNPFYSQFIGGLGIKVTTERNKILIEWIKHFFNLEDEDK